ncbi:Gfo/Idh/MocA family oxidoreductase [Paenarthrobacter sp. NPDC089322]|uniref:Gfo/Idh/MocA family protein n=1 Tax=Paenarthrobacter sp. NPDC089322 TaxID=3155065 RepID=UPI003422F49F
MSPELSARAASQEPTPVKIGLVGAGQWAATMHAPLHAAGAETRLTGIWSPGSRHNAARLAKEFGVCAFDSYEELLACSEAVDFAVPPTVQADLAPQAADAGLGLLLEKPLGVSLAQATRVADAIRRNGSANAVVLTKRYHARTRQFVTAVADLRAKGPVAGVTGTYLHGGFLEAGFLTGKERNGWRSEYGALYDLGPHLLDLMELAAGPVVAVRTDGTNTYTALTTHHADGATSQAVLSGSVTGPSATTTLNVHSPVGSLEYSTRGMDHSECWPALRREFAEAVRHGTPPTVDVERALIIQEIVEAAALSAKEHRQVWVDEVRNGGR